MKKLLTAITLGMTLMSCNGGGGSGSTPQLTSYPTSGSYIGTAKSNNNNTPSTASGTISGSTGNFLIVTNVGSGTITGTFQLNNDTCFAGSETIQSKQTSFIATNCAYSNDTLTAQYQTGLGDTGSLTLTLQ